MKKNYPVPAAYLERETGVKKSRFIARVAPVSTQAELKDWMEQAHQEHHDARQTCWQYIIGSQGYGSNVDYKGEG